MQFSFRMQPYIFGLSKANHRMQAARRQHALLNGPQPWEETVTKAKRKQQVPISPMAPIREIKRLQSTACAFIGLWFHQRHPLRNIVSSEAKKHNEFRNMHKEFRLVNAKKIILWALVRKHQWDENQTVSNDNSSDLNIRNLRLFFAAYLPFFPHQGHGGRIFLYPPREALGI